MFAWSLPDTAAKARLLNHLMNAPIRREHAIELLSDVLGDHELFDYFHCVQPDDDVRCLVLIYLENLMSDENKHLRQDWEPLAEVFCQQIIRYYEGPKPANQMVFDPKP